MGVIRYKIWHDLWENKGRTLQVILIIAVGAFAVGLVLGAKTLITQDLTRTWQHSNPATIGLSAEPAVDEGLVETLDNLPGIDVATGWMQKKIQWRRSPAEAWEPATLIAVDDYEAQEIRRIFVDEGEWPHRRSMGVQRARGLTVGEQVQLEIEERVQPISINGLLYNAAIPPARIEPNPVFYTTRERFEQLTGEPNYALILATIPEYSSEKVKKAADLVQHELEKQDIEVNPAVPIPGGLLGRTSHPDRFIAQDVFDGVFLILNIMAALTLILGLFLVYNTINAIITQQVSQIGIMKAIGGTFHQILRIYTALVMVYAVLALGLALPLGAIAAHGLRVGIISGMANMIPGPFEISLTAILAQTSVALLSPLAIAIIPIVAGASITVREAVSTYGLGGQSGMLEIVLAKLELIPRTVTLTIGNTFRNKKRVVLTQMSLIGAGAIFMMITSTYASLVHTFSDVIFSIFEVNVMLNLEQPERITKIEQITRTHPQVKAVEVWTIGKGTARLMDSPETNDDSPIKLRGLPIPSISYRPEIQAGRWLNPSDDYAIVLNQAVAAQMGVAVGDWITIDILTKGQSNWQVVGVLFEPLEQDTALMPRSVLMNELRQTNQGQAVKIQTTQADAATEAKIAAELRALYEANGYNVVASSTDTAHRTTAQRVDQMSVLLMLLSGMAIMIAVVGAIALSGTLSINVLERTREIGVMRAIGASALTISGQFVGEGLLLGWLSWLIAIPLSLPAGWGILAALSTLLNISLVYRFSTSGVLYWFIIITVLATIASYFPARRAAETSVRESLSYA